MNKIEFLSRLNRALEYLPQQEREDILNDYEEHFRISAEMGKTEEETAEGLGSPEELGATYVEGESLERPEEAESSSTTRTARQEEYGDLWEHSTEQVMDQTSSPTYSRVYTSGNGAAPEAYPSQGTDGRQEAFYANQEADSHSPGKQILYAVLIVLLTVWFVVPVGIGLAISFWFVIFSLALASLAVVAALFLLHFIHIGLVLLGAAFLCLGVALILALILYTSWSIKLFSSYFRWCGRVITGRKERVS